MTTWRTSTPEELGKIITELILPELAQLRQELHYLRKHTWPYVQAMKEGGVPLSDIEAKREFFSNLYDEDVKELLGLKIRYGNTMGLAGVEYDRIRKNHPCDTS